MEFIENWFFILKGMLELVAEELGWEDVPDRTAGPGWFALSDDPRPWRW